MVDPIQQQQMMQLQQLQQGGQGSQIWDRLGGLVANALAKRSDGKNDSIGNGIRYTNEGGKGAFSDDQIKTLQQFADNGMDTSQAYGNLANQKFSINGQKFQADKDGLLTPIVPQQEASASVDGGIANGGLIASSPSIPNGAASIGLGADKGFEIGKAIGDKLYFE